MLTKSKLFSVILILSFFSARGAIARVKDDSFKRDPIHFQPVLDVFPGSLVTLDEDKLDEQACFLTFEKRGDSYHALLTFRIAIKEVAWEAIAGVSTNVLPMQDFSGIVHNIYPVTGTNFYLRYAFSVDSNFTKSAGARIEISEGSADQNFLDMNPQAEFTCTLPELFANKPVQKASLE